MTCIVGLEHGGKVYIAGDSAGVAGDYSIETRCDEKVFANDGLLMGFTSSFRMGQLLRYALNVPERSAKTDSDMAYLVIDFIDAVRETFKDHGWMGEDEKRDEGGTWLLGYKSKLYTIHGDFQVAKCADTYAATGCGEHLALGSLHATQNSLLTPEQRLTMALDAACYHSAGVRGPYTILSQ
jgi:ATP-dependent protease HslVU (ClpYQ) peptidase subunit